MTRLEQILDVKTFESDVANGYIRVQTHPTDRLSIANYSEKTQFENHWNSATEACRGLVFNPDTYDVVSSGFHKFRNWDDSSVPYPPSGPMTLSTKFDGSLGIAYLRDDNSVAIATRGSFSSDQAVHATSRLQQYFEEWEHSLNTNLASLLVHGYTPLFEIIYPQNRVVISYGEQDILVLLDVIETRTGHSALQQFDALDWPDKADKRLISGGFSDSLTHEIPQGEEGFVLYWPGSGFRCKMKSAEYVELHRLVTGLSKKSIWEMLGQGKSTVEIKESVPDELFTFVDETAAELRNKAEAVVDQVYEDYMSVVNIDPVIRDERNRGWFAREAQNYPATRPYLFMILDGKQPEDIWKIVWKTLKPLGDTRAFARSEDVE